MEVLILVLETTMKDESRALPEMKTMAETAVQALVLGEWPSLLRDHVGPSSLGYSWAESGPSVEPLLEV